MKAGFFFFLLQTMSDRSLLSCLKVTQCFNERDRRCAAVQPMLSTDPSYDNRTIASTHKMQIWNATNNRDVPRVMKTKFPATVIVSNGGPHNATSHLRSRLESQHQSVPGCAEECGDPLVQSGGRWQTLGVAVGLGAGPQVQRDPGLDSEGVLRLGTLLSHALLLPQYLNTLDYFVWSYVENITNMTSHDTKASLIAAIRRVFAELPPALVEKACFQFRIRIEAVIEAESGYIE